MGTTQNSTIDYNNLMEDFQDDSRDIFKNNVSDYTINDRNFMQNLNQMFGNAMSAKGLNVLDPIYANFFHYNKMGMLGNVDFPRVTRTYCFFTRPELNFSYENINAIPFFKWLYSKPIGKMIMCSLTDPEYFIGGPAALSNDISYSEMMKTITSFVEEQKRLNANYNSGSPASNEFQTWYNKEPDYKFSGTFDQSAIDALNEMGKPKDGDTQSDDPEEVARLQGLDFSGLYDDAALENLDKNFASASASFKKFMDEYSGFIQSKNEALMKAMNVSNGDDLATRLGDMGLHQAKKLLINEHNNNFDKFNFTSPFIPILSNTCLSVTGAKDFQLNEHTYEEDEFSATIKVPTGMDELWGPGTLNASFTDIAYGPVSLLFICWIYYIHYVSRGNILTTREHILERILDYTCSIYIFVIGDDGRRIERWGKFTGCYPTSFPMSGQLEHNTNMETDALQKLSISFSYNRYEPMDPQVFTDFNFLSESEWLVKLKEPLWEKIYSRNSSLDNLNSYFMELTAITNVNELEKLRQLKRPNTLWKTVEANERGMSGKLPMALVEPAPKSGGLTGHSPVFNQQSAAQRKESEWYIDSMTNFWGGYPYINKGSEFIWVLPQWSKAQDVYMDENINTNSDYKQSSGDSSGQYKEESTGYSQHAVQRTAGTKANGFFIGNATLQSV